MKYILIFIPTFILCSLFMSPLLPGDIYHNVKDYYWIPLLFSGISTSYFYFSDRNYNKSDEIFNKIEEFDNRIESTSNVSELIDISNEIKEYKSVCIFNYHIRCINILISKVETKINLIV